ncbi:transcriptional regulator [Sphingomonas sp. H39-1-10]|uniref:helix-turn-helix transcriptional regulator n=1 Tax=Sphingomonas pollutisoli TaxID=3030829 RepID=UPI0023B96C39|nr:helix-turn-helix domain-containing protein [Sphingomonas pollutisoli]MDF0487161.1 transcriptional regulator [Sphingomonas pollutisoli]
MKANDTAALVAFDNLPESAHVASPVVEAMLGVHRATVWRMVQDGRLPAPIKFARNVTRWKVGDLRKALAQFAEAA